MLIVESYPKGLFAVILQNSEEKSVLVPVQRTGVKEHQSQVSTESICIYLSGFIKRLNSSSVRGASHTDFYSENVIVTFGEWGGGGWSHDISAQKATNQ